MNSKKEGAALWDLGLKPRPYNCLLRAGIKSVKELLALSPIQLIQLRGMGFDSYNNIIAQLDVHGYDTTKYPHFEKKTDFYMGGPTWRMDNKSSAHGRHEH